MLILWLPTISIVTNVMLGLIRNLLYQVDFHFSDTILGNAELVVQLYSCQKRLLNALTEYIIRRQLSTTQRLIPLQSASSLILRFFLFLNASNVCDSV